METIASFQVLPDGYVKQILDILACPGKTRTDLNHTVARLELAWQSVRALAGEIYQPKF
jgi:hypothetical protein